MTFPLFSQVQLTKDISQFGLKKEVSVQLLSIIPCLKVKKMDTA